ncbi:MAG: glycosyltransferase family 2 protein [Flexibacteraceae bacterium]
MVPISGIIIAKNEADRIVSCIKSLQSICAEILVIDSYSTDETVKVSEEAGAKVIQHQFEGFGAQKQFAVSQASNNWVLVIDADEVLSNDLQSEIQERFKNNPSVSGFYLPRTFVFLGKQMRGGGEEKKKYLRLFNKQKGNFNHKPVHEDVEMEGEAIWLRGSLLHYSYRDLHHYFEKFNQYTTLAAKELAKQGKRKSGLYLYFRFGISFWQYYLIKGFVKDGFPGFVWSICSAFYPIVKYAKARAIIEKK